MSKEERVCQFYKLSIRKEGDVFPCCLGKWQARLGSIFDEDIFEKIENTNITCECELYKTRDITPDDKMDLQRLHLMFSHECQANCVCCPQHKEKMEREEEHLEKLLLFIEKYHPKYITVLGGEVLIQPKVLDFVENIKAKYPDVAFDTVTNLCVGENTIKRAANIFSDVTISILGFTKNTYNKIMGLDFDITMKNIDYLQNNTNVKIRPKYLTMPTNVYELPLFFEWALNQKSEKIYIHNIFEFNDCCNLEDIFWQKTFAQVENDMKKLLLQYKEHIINQNKHFISFHPIISNMLKIDNNYLDENGFTNIIKITS